MKLHKIEAVTDLLVLLAEAGAGVNGIAHPLFTSAQDVLDDQHMDVSLGALLGSEDEKLTLVRGFVVQLRKGKVKKEFSKGETLAQHTEASRPYLHVLLTLSPPRRLLKEVIVRCGMDVRSVDLAGNAALHAAIDAAKCEHAIEDAGPRRRQRSRHCPRLCTHHSSGARPVQACQRADKVDYVSLRRGSVLHCAVSNGHGEAVRALLDA
eukprot:3934821-Rhodomonas_salina.1